MTDGIRVLLPPYVDERLRGGCRGALKQLAVSIAFDGSVAWALVPLFGGSSQIALVLDYVEIAAPDDGLLRIELGEVSSKGSVPGLFGGHGLWNETSMVSG